MTRDTRMFVMSAGVALTSLGLLLAQELGFSGVGRWYAVSIIVAVLGTLAFVLWRRP